MLEDTGIEVLTTKKGSKIIKNLWIIVLMSLLFGFGYYIKVCCTKLKILPEILTNEEYIHSYSIPFSAITLCPPVYIKSEFLNVTFSMTYAKIFLNFLISSTKTYMYSGFRVIFVNSQITYIWHSKFYC